MTVWYAGWNEDLQDYTRMHGQQNIKFIQTVCTLMPRMYFKHQMAGYNFKRGIIGENTNTYLTTNKERKWHWIGHTLL